MAIGRTSDAIDGIAQPQVRKRMVTTIRMTSHVTNAENQDSTQMNVMRNRPL